MTPLFFLAQAEAPATFAERLAARWEVLRPYAASPLVWSLVLAALGIWLLLPRGNTRLRPLGALLSAASLGLLACILPFFGDWFARILFWLLAGGTVASAVATISMRSPVYSAIWFGLTLLTTAGLFLLQGAQFLGVATIVVYAGAILVTFLFVLMLAQPEGHAYYDRISWGATPTVFATLAGVLIVGGLTYRLGSLKQLPAVDSAKIESSDLLHTEHMAKLGSQLFSRHLVSVEVAGTLLLVAMVGAVAILIQGRDGPVSTNGGVVPRRPDDRQ
jgi:NADH-quinone oxidoreductase subunit J